MSQNVLILGATSGLARAVAARLAARGANLILAGRDGEELARDAANLRLRHGVAATAREFDALDFDGHRGLIMESAARFPDGLDGVLFALGWMPDQRQAASDFATARRMMDLNYTAGVSLLNPAADYLEQRRRGWLCAISSVAGDRGRRSNYLYGAAKSALSAYLSGLRNRLAPAGVAVITVKPGCVDTGMTYGLEKLPPLASRERVAADIDRAILRRTPVVYTPWIWRPIMAAIGLIPERVFQRMRL